MMTVTSIIIRHTFIETGSREYVGNLAWQVIMRTYLVFLVFTNKLFNQLIKSNWNFKKYIYELIAYSLHLSVGILYIAKILIFKNYS